MKKFTKMIAVVTAMAAMAMPLSACSSESSTTSDTYTIGICQLVQHEALDAATQGFQGCFG